MDRKALIYNNITKKQWHEHFLKVFSTAVTSDAISQQDEFASAETDEEMHGVLFNEVISKQEVIASISDLKAGKSAALDKILGEMLKHANEVVADFLVELFNKLFDCETFPLGWSESTIVPIYKKGDRCKPTK